MTDGERLRKFKADFARFKRNREQVPLDQLRTRYADAYNALEREVLIGADWFADTHIARFISRFPRSPQDIAGNKWLDRRLAAIRQEEGKPGRRVEQYRAALLEQLDWEEFERFVFEIYNRLEAEAFDPYWQRHNRWVGEPGQRWIYNDITRKFWYEPGDGKAGYWINSDYTGRDGRFPPHI